MNDILVNKIMDYLKNTFNYEYSSFLVNTITNFISYAVDNFNNDKNQLAYYLSDMIDELTFNEINAVIENEEREMN